MDGIEVVIGDAGSDHVGIRVLSRTEQAVRDYWDSNWLVTVVSVSAGGWKGANENAFFRTEEISRLRASVERLSEGKLSDADFAPMEPHLQFRLRAGDGGGRISVSGTALDRLRDGNALSFRFEIDRGALPGLAARLREVEKAFPTIG